MSRPGLLVLFIIHVFYAFKRIILSLVPARTPKPLLARRRRIPGHLAVILVPDAENHDAREEETVMEECVEQIVDWCKKIGVQRLSVYEPDGVLSRNSQYGSFVSRPSPLDFLEEVALKPPGYPLTPPPSDTDPTSRSRSPDIESHSRLHAVTTVHIPYVTRDDAFGAEKKIYRRRRQTQLFESKPRQKVLTLHILSRESSKPAIAAAARSFAVTNDPQQACGTFNLPLVSLNDQLEGEDGFPSPDLIIVHPLHPSTSPLELHGFPPWQIRLSEMYYAPRRPRVIRKQDPASMTLSEVEFRRALDDYSGAEMRLGK